MVADQDERNEIDEMDRLCAHGRTFSAVPQLSLYFLLRRRLRGEGKGRKRQPICSSLR